MPVWTPGTFYSGQKETVASLVPFIYCTTTVPVSGGYTIKCFVRLQSPQSILVDLTAKNDRGKSVY